MTATRLILLGPPGSGKGTQAESLVATLNIPKISTGDMLRAAVSARTEIGMKAKCYMEAGELVPDEVVIGVAGGRLEGEDAERGFILDGFPRTVVQAEALDKLLEKRKIKLECCLALRVEEDELVRRLLRRATIEGRSDDKQESIRTRMGEYRKQTEPLVDYYRAQGVLREIDGQGDISDIFIRIEKAIGA